MWKYYSYHLKYWMYENAFKKQNYLESFASDHTIFCLDINYILSM